MADKKGGKFDVLIGWVIIAVVIIGVGSGVASVMELSGKRVVRVGQTQQTQQQIEKPFITIPPVPDISIKDVKERIFAPTVTRVTGRVVVGRVSQLRVEGDGFDPATVQVVVYGTACRTDDECVVPTSDIAGSGNITTELITSVPVLIRSPGAFELSVRNGVSGRLSQRLRFVAIVSED